MCIDRPVWQNSYLWKRIWVWDFDSPLFCEEVLRLVIRARELEGFLPVRSLRGQKQGAVLISNVTADGAFHFPFMSATDSKSKYDATLMQYAVYALPRILSE